jgi:hypothetical protein
MELTLSCMERTCHPLLAVEPERMEVMSADGQAPQFQRANCLRQGFSEFAHIIVAIELVITHQST